MSGGEREDLDAPRKLGGSGGGGKKIGPMPMPPHQLDLSRKPLQTRSEVLIDTANDAFYKQQQSNTPAQNLVIPENSKSKIASSSSPHIPIKVHVSHQPTVEDITRVYNPYPLQNEFDKYMMDGFVFEPLRKSNNRVGDSLRVNHPNANVAFASEVISPYARRDGNPNAPLYSKNPVDNDKLLTVARGYNNQGFEDDRDRGSSPQQKSLAREPSSDFLKARPQSSKAASSESREQLPRYEESKVTPPDQVYQDELDLANKFYKSAGTNQDKVENINREIKRIKTGYNDEPRIAEKLNKELEKE